MGQLGQLRGRNTGGLRDVVLRAVPSVLVLRAGEGIQR